MRIAVLFLPCPDALDQSLAADIVPGLVFLLLELLFHHRLRGDAGMIDPGNPDRVEPAHAMLADENILQRVVDRMAQMQRPGDIRRRNDDAIRLPRRLRVGRKASLLDPDPAGLCLDRDRDHSFWRFRRSYQGVDSKHPKPICHLPGLPNFADFIRDLRAFAVICI